MESCSTSVFASSCSPEFEGVFPRLIMIDYCPWEYCILVLSFQIGNVAYCFMSDVNVNGFYNVFGYSLPTRDYNKCGV